MKKILVSIILMGMMTTAAAQNMPTPEQALGNYKKSNVDIPHPCNEISIFIIARNYIERSITASQKRFSLFVGNLRVCD